MASLETTIVTNAPAPTTEVIERQTREQFEAVSQVRRIVSDRIRPRMVPESGNECLSWARGLARDHPAGPR